MNPCCPERRRDTRPRPSAVVRDLKSRSNDEAGVQSAASTATVVVVPVIGNAVDRSVPNSHRRSECREMEQGMSGILTREDSQVHRIKDAPTWWGSRSSQCLALREQLRHRAFTLGLLSWAIPVPYYYIHKPETVNARRRSVVQAVGVRSRREVEHHHGCLLGNTSRMGTLELCMIRVNVREPTGIYISPPNPWWWRFAPMRVRRRRVEKDYETWKRGEK